MSFASRGERPTWRTALEKLALRVALVMWAVLCLTAVSSLAAAHLYALPRPSMQDARLLRALEAQRAQIGAVGRYSATHVLYARCVCSQRVVGALIARGPLAPYREVVVSVGGEIPRASALRARGFTLHVTSPTELSRTWGVEAAPLLLVTGPDGALRYVGGYSDRKQGSTLRDREILDRVSAGTPVNPLPAFGCAVSKQLQQLADPLGLKYGGGERR